MIYPACHSLSQLVTACHIFSRTISFFKENLKKTGKKFQEKRRLCEIIHGTKLGNIGQYTKPCITIFGIVYYRILPYTYHWYVYGNIR